MFYSQMVWEYSYSHLSSMVEVVMKCYQSFLKNQFWPQPKESSVLQSSAQSDMFFLWPELGQRELVLVPGWCNQEESLNLKTVFSLHQAVLEFR